MTTIAKCHHHLPWNLSKRDYCRSDPLFTYHVSHCALGFLRVINLIYDGVEQFAVNISCELFEVVVAEMRLVGPRWFIVEDLRSELFETHVNLKLKLKSSSFSLSQLSYLEHCPHEGSVVVRGQVFLGGMNQTPVRCEELFDEICVVVEMRCDEHNVVFVVSTQKLVQERGLFDAFFIEICLEAVV